MANTHQVGTSFTVYLLLTTDTVGNVTTTVFTTRPTVSASTRVVDPRAPVVDYSAIAVQEAEAVLLTDGTTRVLGITCTLESAPGTSDSTILADFRASLAGDATAQATFDTISALLP